MKAVLVLDEMPRICIECPLSANHICMITGKDSWITKRPYDCPLRPMPEKVTETLDDGSFMDGSDYGWNECIKAIEGSES